jgi:hypothetical protein
MSLTKARLPHPINIVCHSRLRDPWSNRNKTIYLYLCSIPFYPKFYLGPNCCSSFIPMMIEGVVDGMSTLGKPKARLPRRSASRPGILWLSRWGSCKLVRPVCSSLGLFASRTISGVWPNLVSVHFLSSPLGKRYFGFYSKNQSLAIWCLSN